MTYKSCPGCGNDKKMTGVYECVKCRKIICGKCGTDKRIHACGTSGGKPLGSIG